MINLGGTTVRCPECQNTRTFSAVNITGTGGRLTCTPCGTRLIVSNGQTRKA